MTASLVLADVSEFQGTIDWAAYGKTNPAVIVRAHNGWRADNFWARNAAGAKTYCRWWMPYQYLPASVDPVAARHAFEATIAGYHPHGVLLDLEEGTGNQTPRAEAWLNAGPGFEVTYSGLYFMRTRLAGLPGPKIIAAYQAGEPTDAHLAWQFTDRRPFPGITKPCDASLFHGTIADLLALTDPKPAPVPVPVNATRRFAMLVFALGSDYLFATAFRHGVVTQDLTEARAAIARGEVVKVLGGPAAAALGMGSGQHGNTQVIIGQTFHDTAVAAAGLML